MSPSQALTINSNPPFRDQMIMVIGDYPNLTKAELIAKLGWDERTVRRWLRALEEEKVITTTTKKGFRAKQYKMRNGGNI